MMPAVEAHRRDERGVRILAIAGALLLALTVLIRALVPGAAAPRVNIRWAAALTDPERRDLERELRLLDGERLDGTTWAYDLGDPSPVTVQAIVVHPSVADTHYIDRANGTVAVDAPAGRTRIRGGLSIVRDALIFAWLQRFSAAVLIICVAWLGVNTRRRGRIYGAAVEHRQTGNDPA
jgi:hypothetical protein